MINKGSRVLVREGRYKGKEGVVEYCILGVPRQALYVRFAGEDDCVLFNDRTLLQEVSHEGQGGEEGGPEDSALPPPENGSAPPQPVARRTPPVEPSLVPAPAAQPREPLSHKLLLKLPEVSELTGLGRDFLLRAVKGGELKAVKIGGAWRIKRSDLDAYLEKL